MEKAHPIQLIVGLGNPGPKYEATRHNAGVWLIDAICKQHNLLLKVEPKFHARMAQWSFGNHACWILVPTTFMNHSGQAVSAFAEYYKIPTEAILIAHDELDLLPGTVRLKTDGGHAGHNGLRDVIHHLNNRAFHRVRLGIGHPGNKDIVADYVLERPSKADEQKIRTAIEDTLPLLPQIVTGDWHTAVHQLHSKA